MEPIDLTQQLHTAVNKMREYQKKHNIKRQCLTNVTFLYDLLKENNIETNNVKVVAVIAVSNDKQTQTMKCVNGHVVLLIDNENIIDPSYDVYSLPDVQYYSTYNNFINSFDDKKRLIEVYDMKEVLRNHLQFQIYAKQIQKGTRLAHNNKYYNTLKNNIPMNIRPSNPGKMQSQEK